MFLLDTNIAIHALQGNDRVIAKIGNYEGNVALSALTLAELQPGLFAVSGDQALKQKRLEAFLARIPVFAFTVAAVEAYGQIVAARGYSRAKAFDRMIAAHALSVGAVLITDNTADFADIPGLTAENWVTA